MHTWSTYLVCVVVVVDGAGRVEVVVVERHCRVVLVAGVSRGAPRTNGIRLLARHMVQDDINVCPADHGMNAITFCRAIKMK